MACMPPDPPRVHVLMHMYTGLRPHLDQFLNEGLMHGVGVCVLTNTVTHCIGQVHICVLVCVSTHTYIEWYVNGFCSCPNRPFPLTSKYVRSMLWIGVKAAWDSPIHEGSCHLSVGYVPVHSNRKFVPAGLPRHPRHDVTHTAFHCVSMGKVYSDSYSHTYLYNPRAAVHQRIAEGRAVHVCSENEDNGSLPGEWDKYAIQVCITLSSYTQ